MNLPILMYHSVSPNPNRTDWMITSSMFEMQVGYLKRRGFQTVSLAQVSRALHGEIALPRRAVIFTFDDALTTVAEHAKPILDRAGFSATVFAVADTLGRHNVWDDGKGLPRETCLTAADLAVLHRAGWEIGSHGGTHCSLTGLSPDALREETTGSRQRLAQATGVPVEVFSYPYGALDDAARSAVQAAGYRAACAISPGTSSVTADPMALRRIYVKPSDSLRDFARKISGWYLAFRAWRGR